MPEVSGANAGRILGVSDKTVHRHIVANRLNARREGLSKTWWIDTEDLRKFAQEYSYRFNEELAKELVRN